MSVNAILYCKVVTISYGKYAVFASTEPEVSVVPFDNNEVKITTKAYSRQYNAVNAFYQLVESFFSNSIELIWEKDK